MSKFQAFNIRYDTDGPVHDLPETMILTASSLREAEMDGADIISDETGFCVVSFQVRPYIEI